MIACYFLGRLCGRCTRHRVFSSSGGVVDQLALLVGLPISWSAVSVRSREDNFEFVSSHFWVGGDVVWGGRIFCLG